MVGKGDVRHNAQCLSRQRKTCMVKPTLVEA